MFYATIRTTASVVCLALFFGGCAATAPSTEVRLLDAYSKVSQVRSKTHSDLADGKLTDESWRLAINQIDAAGSALDRATVFLNNSAIAEAEARIATSQKILERVAAGN